LVLGYSYAGSPVVTDDGTAAPAEDPIDYTPSAHPGCLLPHVWLADGRSIYDGLGAGFTLLTLPAADPAAADRVRAAAERHRIPVTVLALTPGDTDLDAAQLRDRWGADLLLVRPDQHVAWRGSDPGAAAAGLLRAAGW